MSTESEWRTLRRRLEAKQQSVAEEIHSYPPPIPACDAQFNHLLEQRRVLGRELARLDLAAKDQAIAITDFIRSSPYEEALLM